ncbi:kinase-like protein [Ascoidea rubescens DSM 1968]|uniref:Serine/threonine-protein kinase BUR1 n=1 Tax=Ascoidea rubescens DSM 1968 TaxID=1344418 RepID=A0A1D2VIE9_9ASCO|nr:kinase-like protein [Ascoidea rubescens DSM 1968]ODV61431.1 kinase-like protein [Ascoidea rubescens DSM 1968]
MQNQIQKPVFNQTVNLVQKFYDKPFNPLPNLNEYELLNDLGQGTFGVVSKAKQKKSNRTVAIKRLKHYERDKNGFSITSLREILILKNIKNINIIQIIDIIVERKKRKDNNSISLDFYMVTPYMPSDLTGILQNPRISLTYSHKKCFIHQILKAVNFLHENNIIHRDIKTSNILINFNGTLKLADFGLARKYYGSTPSQHPTGNPVGKFKYTATVVTRWYRAPELVYGEIKYTQAIDIWSIGCVIGELFLKSPILTGKTDLDQGVKIFALCGTPFCDSETLQYYQSLPAFKTNVGLNNLPFRHSLNNVFLQLMDDDEEGIKFLSRFLNLNPFKRINTLEALNDNYFNLYPLPCLPEELPEFEESHEIDIERFKKERQMNNFSPNRVSSQRNDFNPYSKQIKKSKMNSTQNNYPNQNQNPMAMKYNQDERLAKPYYNGDINNSFNNKNTSFVNPPNQHGYQQNYNNKKRTYSAAVGNTNRTASTSFGSKEMNDILLNLDY